MFDKYGLVKNRGNQTTKAREESRQLPMEEKKEALEMKQVEKEALVSELQQMKEVMRVSEQK